MDLNIKEKSLLYFIANNKFGEIDGFYSITKELRESGNWVSHLHKNDIKNIKKIPFDLNLILYLYDFIPYDEINDDNIKNTIKNLIIDGFIIKHKNFPYNFKIEPKGFLFYNNSRISENKIVRSSDDYNKIVYEYILSLDDYNINTYDFILDLNIIDIDKLIKYFSDNEKFDICNKLKELKELKEI